MPNILHTTGITCRRGLNLEHSRFRLNLHDSGRLPRAKVVVHNLGNITHPGNTFTRRIIRAVFDWCGGNQEVLSERRISVCNKKCAMENLKNVVVI